MECFYERGNEFESTNNVKTEIGKSVSIIITMLQNQIGTL